MGPVKALGADIGIRIYIGCTPFLNPAKATKESEVRGLFLGGPGGALTPCVISQLEKNPEKASLGLKLTPEY